MALSYWHPNLSLSGDADQIPIQFRPELIWQMVWQIGQDLRIHLWQIGLIVGLAIALLDLSSAAFERRGCPHKLGVWANSLRTLG